MGVLLTEQIKNVYRTNVRNLKIDFTRNPINIYWVENGSLCPNCKWDSINKCSTNRVSDTGLAFSGTCPVCKGRGKLAETNSVAIHGTVFYPGQDGANQISSAEAGGIFEFHKCELSVLKEESYCQSGTFSGKMYFDFASYFEFDGHRWTKDSDVIPGGLGEDFVYYINLKRANKTV